MARQIIMVGMARTGTMHIANLFKQLFIANGIQGISQHQGPLSNMHRDADFFDSDWRKSFKMIKIAREFSYIRFLVMYRDPIDCCSSLKYFYQRRHHAEKNNSIEWFLKNYWIHCYRYIISQIDSLIPRPHFLDFEKYINGEYNKLLLDLFGIPKTEDNLLLIKEELGNPLNTYGEYEKYFIPLKKYMDATNMGNVLKKKCDSSWVTRELYGDEDFSNVNLNYPCMNDMYKQKLFGVKMGQTFTALYVFEWILNLYKVSCIVELGTGRGGLSLFLKFQAGIRKLRYFTYDAMMRMVDVADVKNPASNVKETLKGNFVQKDVFSSDTIREISSILQSEIVLMYCDNGAKPKEIKTYAPFLGKGSIIGVHDWNNRFDIDDLVEELNLQAIFVEFCEEQNTRQRFWYKWK